MRSRVEFDRMFLRYNAILIEKASLEIDILNVYFEIDLLITSIFIWSRIWLVDGSLRGQNGRTL